MHFPLQEVFFFYFQTYTIKRKKNLLKRISNSIALFVKNMVCIHQFLKNLFKLV